MIREDNYIPEYSRAVAGRKPFRSEVIADRKERFAALNKYVTARNGWLTSIPGEREVTMECLPDSTLPDELRAGAEFMLGDEKVRLPPYKVVADGEGRAHPAARGHRPGPAVRFRHALTVARLNVRCWENSGRHLLAVRISPFDPKRTSQAEVNSSKSQKLPKLVLTFASAAFRFERG